MILEIGKKDSSKRFPPQHHLSYTPTCRSYHAPSQCRLRASIASTSSAAPLNCTAPPTCPSHVLSSHGNPYHPGWGDGPRGLGRRRRRRRRRRCRRRCRRRAHAARVTSSNASPVRTPVPPLSTPTLASHEPRAREATPAAPREYTLGRAQVQVGVVRAECMGIRGKSTGAAQFPIESVSEKLAREQ